MIGFVFLAICLGSLFVGLGVCVISAQLCRIADAVEAQNRHYGVPVDTPAGKEAA